MANIDMSDPMAMHFMDGNPSTYQMFGPYPSEITTQEDSAKTSTADQVAETFSPHSHSNPLQDDCFPTSIEGTMGLSDIFIDGYSRLGTPAGGTGGDTWESFVDFGSEQ